MKIAFIGQKGIPATYGGVERYVEEVSTRLASRGHFVWVYTRPYYTVMTDRLYKGVHLVSIPTIRSKHLDTGVHTFLSILHLMFRDVDVIYVHSVGPSFFIPFMRLVKPHAKVISVFQSQDDKHQKWGAFARFMLRLATWVACKTPHATVTSSKGLYAHAKEMYKAETVQIYNGAPDPKEIRSNEMEKRFELTHGSYFLMVTRFVRHKNIHKVISAFKKLETDKKLVIAGGAVFTDAYYQELLELAGSDPRIIFTGFVAGADLWELFQKAYAFVQASESEGLPLAVLEAMAYGCGVIASNIPEHQETLAQGALYFDLQEKNGLENALAYALTHPQALFDAGTFAKQRARNTFSWDAITDEVESLFVRVLEDKKLQTVQQKSR